MTQVFQIGDIVRVRSHTDEEKTDTFTDGLISWTNSKPNDVLLWKLNRHGVTASRIRSYR